MATGNDKKPKLEEEDKNEIGQRLGMIVARYPTSRKLREADVSITITTFVGNSKSSSTGTLVDVSGKVESIDFTMSRVVIDGHKYKLSEIFHVELGDGFENALDDVSYDDFGDDYGGRHLTEREKAELEKMRDQQRKDYERQMQREQERQRLKWEAMDRERNRDSYSCADSYPDDVFSQEMYGRDRLSHEPDYSMMGDYIPDDSVYCDVPFSEEKIRELYDGISSAERTSTKATKKDNWRLSYLPPKKKKEPKSKKKAG